MHGKAVTVDCSPAKLVLGDAQKISVAGFARYVQQDIFFSWRLEPGANHVEASFVGGCAGQFVGLCKSATCIDFASQVFDLGVCTSPFWLFQ